MAPVMKAGQLRDEELIDQLCIQPERTNLRDYYDISPYYNRRWVVFRRSDGVALAYGPDKAEALRFAEWFTKAGTPALVYSSCRRWVPGMTLPQLQAANREHKQYYERKQCSTPTSTRT